MIKDVISYKLHDDAIVNFVYDETIPINFVYWDTVNTYKQYKNFSSINKNISEFAFDVLYNIPLESSIKKISENVDHIYKYYIVENNESNSLRSYPEAQSSMPTWVTFNPEKKMYSFDSSLFFTVSVDKSSMRQCAYATKPYGLSQTSDYYQYANVSKNCVCSNPIFAKTNSVSTCGYIEDSNLAFIKNCPGYTVDEKVLFVNTITHKTNKELFFEFKTTVYRNLEDVYKIEVFNVTENVLVSVLNYKSIIFNKNKSSLYEEAKNHLIELLKVYEEDYTIEWKEDNLINNISVVNTKAKNNYIFNLIPKDSYDHQRNKLSQTV